MIIGVDIGTSVTKASAVLHDGRVGDIAAIPSVLNRLPGGRVEQDIAAVVAAVADVVRRVAADATEPVEAVAITGQGDGLWLRDDSGAAIRPAISWMDARASDIVEEWNDGGPAGITQRVHRLTGSGVFPGSQAALLAWLDRHEPDSLERATVAGYCVDSVVHALTGRITTDASDASLPFLDVRSRQYVPEALALCGVDRWRHLLAPPAAPGTVFALDARGAEVLGLPQGTPVTGGPYDLQACGFGCGTLRPGEGTLVVGTTLSCQVLTRDTTIPPGAEPAGMWLCTPDPGLFLRVMPSMVGTASVDWLTGMLGLTAGDIDRMLELSPPRANGVTALPFFSPSGERAPFLEPRARGRLSGLQLGTDRADAVRALCEALAYAARHCFDVLGLDGELAVCGGGLQSRTWTQIFADVLGRPIFHPADSAVGARGAAMVSWSALGRPIDEEAWRARRRRVDPVPAHTAVYEEGYHRYLEELTAARSEWRDEP